jgi:hypothetical protein
MGDNCYYCEELERRIDESKRFFQLSYQSGTPSSGLEYKMIQEMEIALIRHRQDNYMRRFCGEWESEEKVKSNKYLKRYLCIGLYRKFF